MRHTLSSRRFTQYYKNNFLLKEKLSGIESGLNRINNQLKESDKRNLYSVGAGAGLAGLGMALGISITSPTWVNSTLQPSHISFILLALSIAIIFWSFLGFRGKYRNGIAVIGTVLMILGSVAFTFFDIYIDSGWANLASIFTFLSGWIILPISVLKKSSGAKS